MPSWTSSKTSALIIPKQARHQVEERGCERSPDNGGTCNEDKQPFAPSVLEKSIGEPRDPKLGGPTDRGSKGDDKPSAVQMLNGCLG